MFNIYYKVTHYTTLTTQSHKLDTWPLECVQAMMSLNTQQATLQFWAIPLTISKKSFHTLIFCVWLYTCT